MGALIWSDDFETYAAGVIPSPWINETGGIVHTDTIISTAQPHGGTKSVAIGAGGNTSNAHRLIGSSLSTWYADFWMWTNNSGASTNQFVAFSSTTSSSNMASVNVAASGAGRCGLANLPPWFTFSVSLLTWHHYRLEVFSNVAGTATLTVDGVVVGTFAGDTRGNLS